jgi:hypothetical protein
MLLDLLRSDGNLPSAGVLSADVNLAAAALRAIDLLADSRLKLVLQADDPTILASSYGAMQLTLNDMARWAYLHKVSFHVDKAKTVLLTQPSGVTLFLPILGKGVAPIVAQPVHKYLGILWPGDLVFTPALLRCIQVATGITATLSGLVHSSTLPLSMGVAAFRSKVEGYLRYGSWLLATAPNAEEALNRAYATWARMLLDSPAWRNGFVAIGELGWRLTGMHAMVKDVALRRARLWLLPPDDFYSVAFRSGQDHPLE